MDRPQGGAGQGHLRLGQRPGNPEVGDLHPPVLGDQDVGGLDIAMDDAASVGGRDCASHVGGDTRRLARRQRAVSAQERGQVLAIDIVHDDVGARRIHPEVMHGHHVRAAERGHGARLKFKPGHEVRVTAVLGSEQLDGNIASKLSVGGAIDRGHAALAQQFDQAISPAEDASDLRQIVPSLLPSPPGRPRDRLVRHRTARETDVRPGW